MSNSHDTTNMEELQDTQMPFSPTKLLTTTSNTITEMTRANSSEILAEHKDTFTVDTSNTSTTKQKYTKTRSKYANDAVMGAIRHKRVYDWRLNNRVTQSSQESSTKHTETYSPCKTLLQSDEPTTELELSSPSPRTLPISPLHRPTVHAQSLFATNIVNSRDDNDEKKKDDYVKYNNYVGSVGSEEVNDETSMQSVTNKEIELKDVHVSALLTHEDTECSRERRTSASMESIARSSVTSVSALMDEAQEKCAKVAYRVSFHGDSRVQQRVMTVMMNGLTFVLVERLVPGTNNGVYLKSRKVWEHIPIGQVRVFALEPPASANKRKTHEENYNNHNEEEQEESEESSSSLSPVTNSPTSLPLSPLIETNNSVEPQVPLYTRVLFNNDELSSHRTKGKRNEKANREVHAHNSTESLCNRGYVLVTSLNGLRKFAHWDEDISGVMNNTTSSTAQHAFSKDGDNFVKSNINKLMEDRDSSFNNSRNSLSGNTISNCNNTSNYHTAYSVTREMPCYAIITERVDGESGQVTAMEWENERYWLIGCHDCHLLLRWHLPEDDIEAYNIRPWSEEIDNNGINTNPPEVPTTSSENVTLNMTNDTNVNKGGSNNKKAQSSIKEMRIILSQRIARAWRDWLNAHLSADEIVELHNVLCNNEWTLNFALIAQNEYEHFVDYWYHMNNTVEENEESDKSKNCVESFEAKDTEIQKKNEWKKSDLLRFFAITRDAAIDKGLCVPVLEAMQLFKQFHLSSVWFDAQLLQVNSAEYHVMRQRICSQANSVGGVFYGMDCNGRVIRLWKCRNYPYILERTAQEAILTHRLHGDMFVKRIMKKRLNLSRDGRLCTLNWERERLPFLTLFANWLFTSKHITLSTDLHSIRVLRNKWVTLQHEFTQHELQEKLQREEREHKRNEEKKKKKKKCKSQIIKPSCLIHTSTYQDKVNRGANDNSTNSNCDDDDMTASNNKDAQVNNTFIKNDDVAESEEEEEHEEKEEKHEELFTSETCEPTSPLQSCQSEEMEEEMEDDQKLVRQTQQLEQEERELEETNVQINTTDVILLVGPQGCGKSTLARALYYLLELYGYRPRWLNQDEIGNKRLFLQAIEEAVTGNKLQSRATHLIIDKMNINEEMRSDYYDKLQLKVVLTVVWAHTAGMDALAETCIERILHRGNNHRSLAVNDFRSHTAEKITTTTNNNNESCNIDNIESNNISINTMNPLSSDTLLSSSSNNATNKYITSSQGTVQEQQQQQQTFAKMESDNNSCNKQSNYTNTNRRGGRKNNQNGMTLQRMQGIVRTSVASYELPLDNSVLQLDVNLEPQHVLEQVWARLQERGLYELPCELGSEEFIRALEMSHSYEALLSKFPHKYTSVMLFAISPDLEIFRHVPFALLSTSNNGNNSYYRQPSRKREVRDVCIQVHSFVRQPCPVAFVHYAHKVRSVVKVKLEFVLSDYNTTLMIVSAVDNQHDMENSDICSTNNNIILRTNNESSNSSKKNSNPMLVSLSTHQCGKASNSFFVQDDSVCVNSNTEYDSKQKQWSEAATQMQRNQEMQNEQSDSAETINYSQVASCYAILARSRQVNYDYYDFLVWNYVTNHIIDPYCIVYKFPENTYAHFRYEFVEKTIREN